MKKYIFTESQIKKIVDNQLNEQTMESYEGEIVKVVNGVAKVKATSEMGNIKYFTVKLKVNVPVGTKVFVGIKNGLPEIYGGKSNQKLN
jgi:hypothetical protein